MSGAVVLGFHERSLQSCQHLLTQYDSTATIPSDDRADNKKWKNTAGHDATIYGILAHVHEAHVHIVSRNLFCHNPSRQPTLTDLYCSSAFQQ